MKRLLILALILSLSSLSKQTSAEEILEIKKTETAPFDGVLLPYDAFRDYEKSQRALDYMINNPVVCEEPVNSSFPSIIFGTLIGVLVGLSVH